MNFNVRQPPLTLVLRRYLWKRLAWFGRPVICRWLHLPRYAKAYWVIQLCCPRSRLELVDRTGIRESGSLIGGVIPQKGQCHRAENNSPSFALAVLQLPGVGERLDIVLDVTGIRPRLSAPKNGITIMGQTCYLRRLSRSPIYC